jgi:hypothetical protein
MPSTTRGSPPSGRKRRREEFSTGIEMQKKLSRQAAHLTTSLSSTLLLTLFSPHLQRYASIPEPATILNTTFNNRPHYERRQLIPKLKRHDHKRQRVEPSHSIEKGFFFTREPPSPDSDGTLERHAYESTDQTMAASKLKMDLSPCHVCHRRPTVKSELDAFADCEGCTKRTCYICIRECLGVGIGGQEVAEGDYDVLDFSLPGAGDELEFGTNDTLELSDNLRMRKPWEKPMAAAHRRMICSRCCVETGTEGEVWCLGCFRD